jgi:hypothetical protein
MSDDAKWIREALAGRLDLRERPSGGLQGTLDGAPLQVGVQLLRPAHAHGHASVLDLQTGTLQPVAREPLGLRVTAALHFAPALDAQLRVRPGGGFHVLASAQRRGFEQRFTWTAAEPSRGEALLPRAAREALDAAFVGDPGVSVTDQFIGLDWQRPAPYPTVDELVAALAPLARAWHAIVDASRSVAPPSGLEEVLVALGAMPLPPGVELRGSPVGVAGAVDGVPVSVSVGRHASGRWSARARVGLPSIPGAPRVVREGRFGWFERLAAAVGGRGEIVVGDAAFDHRFAVRSLRPDALRDALSPAVREAMLALDARVAVELWGARIDGVGPVDGEESLRAVVAAALDLARAVGARG